MPARMMVASLAAVAFVEAAAVAPPASAAEPSLKIFTPIKNITLKRGRGKWVTLDARVYVAAQGGPLEIRVRRPDYDHPLEAVQVVHTETGSESRPLSPDVLDGWFGLKDFFHLDVLRTDGSTAARATAGFCPDGWDQQRVNDEGPVVSSYPSYCSANPFTKSMVWGIDEGWATSAFDYDAPAVKLKDGTYTLSVSIDPRYVELFGIAPEDATTRVTLKVKTAKRCRHCGAGGHGHKLASASDRRELAGGASESAVPTLTDPDPSLLPDLVALPSWGIGISVHRRKGQFLTFGATVWTSGSSPLVVEGFRRPDEEVMDGYQYFYRDGEPVGRAPAGPLEYDARRGHHHWHFKQFAAYRLLDADQSEVVQSAKEAFCLAPTDAIDLDHPGADWNPDLGFHTACGDRTSIWVREILPLGWGDTYGQYLPGQSFDITDLPNGTYYIQVEANPLGLLHEQDMSNNSELRKVILKGKTGRRRVVVPPWHGIDSENPETGPWSWSPMP
jgi:Lysyl oxidase